METSTTYYLEHVPNLEEYKAIVRKNKCKYDPHIYKWYTSDIKCPMIQDFSKKYIDFWGFMNDLGISYDEEKK